MTPEIIAISQALLTPVIAIATTYIAYQQYRIRRDERSLALYDRRLALYKSVIGIVDRTRAGHMTSIDDVFVWLTSITETEFLFGEEVNVVVDELFGAILEYAHLTQELSSKSYTTEWAEAAINVEGFRHALQKVFASSLRPAGSPHRQKKRLSVLAAKKLVGKPDTRSDLATKLKDDREFSNGGDDIPF